MIRVIVFLAAVLAAAIGLSWLSDNPGTVNIYWPAMNLQANPSVFQVIIGLTLLTGTVVLIWSLVRSLWNSPAAVGMMMNRRKQQKGLDALSSGMIAIGAGDRDTATRYAIAARKSLPNEPLTHLLRAQAAQLSGDKVTSRRIFEAMLASPDTEQLGLRGLFVEAQREKEPVAAAQFAARALKLNPKLAWASDSLFEIQCKAADWAGALETLNIARRNNHIDKPLADRRRAVLLTGLALAVEDADPSKALQLATDAHNLAPDLVAAANLAGRMLASRGNTGKAAKILQKTWTRSPHPDLATAYAFARIGDSPRDRLERVKQLAALNPHSAESSIAVANSAIDAKLFSEARDALHPLLDGRLTQRVATLMARIESEEHGDKGRVREWLARAVNAPRDPVWTADGVIAETWAPSSPITGQLDAFQWRVPVEHASNADTELLARRVEELVALGAPASIPDTIVDTEPVPQARTQTKTQSLPEPRPAPKPAAPATVPSKPAPVRSAVVTDVEDVDYIEEIQAAAPAIAVEPTSAKPTAKAAPVGATAVKPAPVQPTAKTANAPDTPAPIKTSPAVVTTLKPAVEAPAKPALKPALQPVEAKRAVEQKPAQPN
ncbi:MAG: heme biosynthesis HemY N-terminal domain-containing protein, partial [Hyphomicrobiaceae bacterium]